MNVVSLQTTLNNSDKQTSGQRPSKNQTNEQAATLDEILRDTHQLLDSLDQKLDAVDGPQSNKTQDKRLETAMRMLREPVAGANQNQPAASRNLEEERRLTSLAEGFSSERRLLAEPLLAAATSELHDQQPNGPKRARQLVGEEIPPAQAGQANSARFTDNQFTERHIQFSLDLMRAVFASHSKSNSLDSFLISPVSIQTVLMMMHLGARGQTRRELANCLNLLPASSTTTTSPVNRDGNNGNNQPNSTASASLSKNPKLHRRHQQQQHQQLLGSLAKQTVAHQPVGGSQRAHVNKQVLQDFQQGNNFHEQFGGAVRQLLKDQSVMKALTSANQIFVQRDLPLSSQFEWAVKNYYGAELRQVDFQNQSEQEQQSGSGNKPNATANNVRAIINDWVERQTRGKISNFLMSPVASSTLLMALNLVFFKGDWQYKFDPADTQPEGLFSLTNGRTAKVPMMVNKLPLAHAHDAQMKVSLIELPYKAQRLSLFILLPDETDGIFDTVRQLTPSSFANLISKMRKPSGSPASATSGPTSGATSSALELGGGGGINVRIPKFTIESSPRMSQILSQQLGLKTLFAPDSADLSGMFSQKARANNKLPGAAPNGSTGAELEANNAPAQVGLDELLHKAMLEVHEQGSVAAAASATIVERVGVFNGHYFEADHPFAFFLMDKQSGLVLFSGVFAGPQQDTAAGQENQTPAAATPAASNSRSKPAQQLFGSSNSTADTHHNHLTTNTGRNLRQTAAINPVV